MSKDTSVVRDYFARLDLEPAFADIYLALVDYGPQTISELSRNAGVERTRIYRLLDTMRELQLCEVEQHYRRNIIKAAPIDNLQLLISRREQELADLRADYHKLERAVDTHYTGSGHHTKLQYYKDHAGLRQMFWNQTRAKGEEVSILYEPMQSVTGKQFFERWASRMNELEIPTRSVVGPHFLQSLNDWYETHQNERLSEWKGRYLDDSVFRITHSMHVYDDTIAYFNWKAGELSGVEIHNKELADTQRQFFELLWAKSTELTKPQAKPFAEDEELFADEA
jgi:hypothetical protein